MLDPAIGRTVREPRRTPAIVRRTVYGKVSRQRVADVLRVFDFPDANRHGEGRDSTTTPLQQLYFLNSPFLLANSARLAGRDFRSPALARRIRRGPLSSGLAPRTERATRPSGRYGLVQAEGGPESREAWAVLAQALLIGNEFLFVD